MATNLAVTLRVLWVTPALDAGFDLLRLLVDRSHEVRVVAGDQPPGERTVAHGHHTFVLEGVDWRVRPLLTSGLPVVHRLEQLALLAIGRTRTDVELRERDRETARLVGRRAQDTGHDVVVAVGAKLARQLKAVEPLVLLDVSDQETARRGARGALLQKAERAASAWQIGAGRRRAQAVVAGEDPVTLVEAITRVARPARTAAAATVRDHSPTGDDPSRATVVIATRDRHELLNQSLPTVLASAAMTPGTEVLVIAQGTRPPEGSCDGARVVEDSGTGVSRARNLGIAEATGAIVLFTDDDCLVPERWVKDHLDSMRSGAVAASCGAVSGLSRSGDCDPARRPLLHRRGAMPWHIGHGSNLAVRREHLLVVSGWDERLGPGTPLPAGEDADLIVRVLEHAGPVRSGVGEPVRHVAWRTEDAHEANLASYEVGAGAWIGKAMRQRRPDARHYLRGRCRLLREQRSSAAWLAFLRGALHGLRLS